MLASHGGRFSVTTIATLALAAVLVNAMQARASWPQAAAPAPANSAGLKLFDESVKQILQTHCVECHGGKKKEADFDMTTREGLLRGGDWGPAVVPGKSEESFLILVLRHEEEPFMPEDKPRLPAEDVAKIAAWIDAGAPYSAPLASKGGANPSPASKSSRSAR